MNAITTARDVLKAEFAGIIDVGDRVHRFRPPIIATPCIYLGHPRLRLRSIDDFGAQATYASIPVYVLVDGAGDSQLEKLDEYVARVWDAAWRVGEPTGSAQYTPDSGLGLPSSVRAQSIDIDMPIAALSLCADS